MSNPIKYTLAELMTMKQSLPGLEVAIRTLQEQLRRNVEALNAIGIKTEVVEQVTYNIDARRSTPKEVGDVMTAMFEPSRPEPEYETQSERPAKKKRVMSEEGREAIRAAVRKRWAAAKKKRK